MASENETPVALEQIMSIQISFNIRISDFADIINRSNIFLLGINALQTFPVTSECVGMVPTDPTHFINQEIETELDCTEAAEETHQFLKNLEHEADIINQEIEQMESHKPAFEDPEGEDEDDKSSVEDDEEEEEEKSVFEQFAQDMINPPDEITYHECFHEPNDEKIISSLNTRSFGRKCKFHSGNETNMGSCTYCHAYSQIMRINTIITMIRMNKKPSYCFKSFRFSNDSSASVCPHGVNCKFIHYDEITLESGITMTEDEFADKTIELNSDFINKFN
jgi:hypothetical protein